MPDDPATASHESSAAYPGTPRWVKVSAIILVVVVVLIIGAMALAGGQHGPAMHLQQQP